MRPAFGGDAPIWIPQTSSRGENRKRWDQGFQEWIARARGGGLARNHQYCEGENERGSTV